MPKSDIIECEKLLRQLKRLQDEGRDEDRADGKDGPGDILRDEMDIFWWNMTDEEQKSMEQLAEDLWKGYIN